MSEKTFGPKRPQVLQLGKLLSAKLTPDTPLLGDLIFAKTIGMVAGPRGGGKSLLAMLMAYAVASGKPVEPWGKGAGMPVAYLDGEMRAIGFQRPPPPARKKFG